MAGREGRDMSSSQKGQLVRAQVEYYFSDPNLQRDRFFRELIARDAGWVDVAPIMQCNKIKETKIGEGELLEAIQGSELLEVQDGRIRRKIPFQAQGKGEADEGQAKGSNKSNGKGGKGKGKLQGDQARAAPVVDPSGPCGYFMAGYCHHGGSCFTQHSVPYAMAIRQEWLNPGDANAKKELQVAAAKLLGEKGARELFPRVFSHKIQSRQKQTASKLSDLGFEWSTEVDAPEAPPKKENRWTQRSSKVAASSQTVTPYAQHPKVRYILVFDLEGKYEIIEFPVLLFDVVAGSEVGRFQKFIRPKDLFAGCPVTQTPAVSFPAALEELNAWLHAMVGKGLEEMGKDSSDMVFMTCGDWDCKHVRTQCQIWGVPAPRAFSQWINIKRSYSEHYGGDFRGMKSMLAKLRLLDRDGNPQHGFHHLGMHDVENITRCLAHLLETDAELGVNGWWT